MNHTEQWIWLPKAIYKNEQATVFSGFDKEKANNYTVAEFKRTYTFSQRLFGQHCVSAEIRCFSLPAMMLLLPRALLV